MHLVKITYLNICYLMKTLRSWHFLISFHMVKEDIIQNKVQSYLYENISNSICLNVEIHFAQNMEYLFCAQYISDIKQIQGDTYLAICLSCRRTVDGQKITAGLLQNPITLHQLVQTEQAYRFLKNIRGPPVYWQHELYDVLAMLCSLGIPT